VTAFDQAGSTTRPALSAALRHAITLIRSADPAAIIYVGGSYVTDKRDPSDLDLAVRSNVWTGAAFDAAFSAAYPSEASLIDDFFNRIGDAQHMEDFFREMMGQPADRKGIIEVLY
jgi:predicted nucleotidyltransferase